ncbi:hypothetical protein ATANTOWER_023761, partial [Ataeniobius toweri]|nr:hypothetical protein [Ataeniobius toweri]
LTARRVPSLYVLSALLINTSLFLSVLCMWVKSALKMMREHSGQPDPAETLLRTVSEHGQLIQAHSSILRSLLDQQRQKSSLKLPDQTVAAFQRSDQFWRVDRQVSNGLVFLKKISESRGQVAGEEGRLMAGFARRMLGPQSWVTTLKASKNFSGTFKINRINLLPAQPATRTGVTADIL